MAARDEFAQSTRVAVVEPRRLIRQTLSIWLASQNDVTFAGSAPTAAAVGQWCRDEAIDLVIVGVDNDRDDVLDDVRLLTRTFPELRLVLLVHEPIDETRLEALAGRGVAAVVSAAGGVEQLTIALEGTRARVILPPAEPLPKIESSNPLTPREAEVLELVGGGSTTWDISEQLGISRSTVANHKERIFEKLRANNQAHAVARAVHLGIIVPGRKEKPRRAG